MRADHKTETTSLISTDLVSKDPNPVSILLDRLASSPSACCFIADTLTIRRTLSALHRLRSDNGWGPRDVTVTTTSQLQLRDAGLRGPGIGSLASGFREPRRVTVDRREDPNPVSISLDRLASSPSAFCFIADTLTIRRTLSALRRLRSDNGWGPRDVTLTMVPQLQLRAAWLRGAGVRLLCAGLQRAATGGVTPELRPQAFRTADRRAAAPADERHASVLVRNHEQVALRTPAREE